MRVTTATFYDIRLQYRHGFYLAYLLVCIGYIVLLRLATSEIRELILPVLIFTDPAMLGIFFVGGIVLLERNDNTLQSLAVTPLKRGEYCAAKVASLSLLAVSTSLLLAVSARLGLGFNWPLLIAGVVLISGLVTLIGIAVASRSQDIVGYIFAATPILIVLAVPLLDYFGVVASHWFYLLPSHAGITLIRAAFQPGHTEAWEPALSMGVLLLSNAAAWYWARSWFAAYALGVSAAPAGERR